VIHYIVRFTPTERKGEKMKRVLIGIIIIIILCGGLAPYITIQRNAGGPRSFAQVKQDPSTWLVKIDGKTITLKEFEQEFNVHVYSLPIVDEDKERYSKDEANKKRFLTNLVNEYLIYNKAVDNGYLKRKDVQALIEAVSRRAVLQVYLNDVIEPKLQEIPDEQIEAIYNQNKKLYTGVDIDVARQDIQMKLLQQQYNNRLNDLIDNLMGEAKVIRNQDVQL
jgi:uncharacterized protein YxeA